MTKITITMSNSGGPLDRTTLRVDGDPQDAGCATLVAEALIDMIRDCGSIHPGDSFTVEEG